MDWNDDVMGGPSDTKEKCEKCDKEWTRHRLGSFDYEYTDCLDCLIEEGLKNILKGN